MQKWVNLQMAWGGQPHKDMWKFRLDAQLTIEKLKDLVGIYKALYGTEELDYFLEEHGLPSGTRE